jgi:PAS domain S-box-containing protein
MDVIPEEYKEEARINLRNLYESKEKNIINEYKFYTLTGKLIDIEISSVLFDFQGKKTILSVIRDVTKRNKIRNELLEKDKALQAIVDLTPSLLLIHQDSKFVMINKAFEKISGYSKEEILGRHYWEFVHPDQREKVKKLGQARLYGVKVPDRYEMKVVRKNGEIAWLDFSARTISWNGKPATLGTAFDITEIKSIQKELKLSEERFRKLFEHNLVVQLIINIDTFQIEDASPAAAKFYGYELEELKGMMYYEISMTEVAELKRRLEQVWNNERNHWIVKHKNSNGDVLDIELYSSPIEMQGDRIIYTLIFDISEKLMIEQQYLHSQKMESVGKLAGGVAHDFNNMLSVILNYALLSLNELDQDSIVYKYVKEIYSAGEKSAQLTSQLLGYARKQTILPEILNINSVINDIMQMIRRLLREDIDIVWNLNEDLWYVKLDVSQLHQIIMNLCVNAGDAIDGAGKIEITTDNVKLEDIKNIHEPLENIKHDKFVKLSVKDNGSGISKKDLKHIFEPFFTTKLSGEGTGLGLATIYGIVKQNDGFITVDSELGIGAEFSIYFPQTDEIIKKIKEEDTSYSTKNHKTILITEDEESILKVTKMILEDCGHKIITSTSPLRSLELAKEYKEIDLLITDVIMPEINGYELAKSIKDICPDIKILFMSGYSEDILTNDGVLEKEINFIQKPYNASDLYNKINKIFDDD